MYTCGGAPLEVALKKNIIHLHYGMLLKPEQIEPLIVSPRCEGSVHVDTVRKVIKHFKIFLTVEHVSGGLPRRRKMPVVKAFILLIVICQHRTHVQRTRDPTRDT